MPYSKNRGFGKSLFLFLHVCGVHSCICIFPCMGVQRCLHLEHRGYVGCLPQSFSTITTEAVYLRWPQSSLTSASVAGHIVASLYPDRLYSSGIAGKPWYRSTTYCWGSQPQFKRQVLYPLSHLLNPKTAYQRMKIFAFWSRHWNLLIMALIFIFKAGM